MHVSRVKPANYVGGFVCGHDRAHIYCHVSVC